LPPLVHSGYPSYQSTTYNVPLERFLKHHPNAPGEVLAYVFAHELAHVMQGADSHSASGILMANWSDHECHMMVSRTLAFSARDVDLIRAGLEKKRSNSATGEGAQENRSTTSSNLNRPRL